MAYFLNGTQIRSPLEIHETNSTQMAAQRTLDGSVSRDYFGSNKRIFELTYTNVKKAAYDTIKTIYDLHLSAGNTVTFESTEANYTIASIGVMVDLQERSFTVRGEDYLSDFQLILTEA